jgi:large subunit ribosomal protein L24
MKLHTGDTVVVITGRDKGKTGVIMRVLRKKQRVVVAGVNMRTKHIKKTPQRAGQRVRYEAGIHVSNVMFIDPKTKKRTRVGYAVDAAGMKRRLLKRSGELLAAPAPRVEKAEQEPQTKQAKGEKKAETGGMPSKKPFWKRLMGREDSSPHTPE